MEEPPRCLAIIFFVHALILTFLLPAQAASSSIPALFLFGDSLSDTGNGPFLNHSGAYTPPYGETYPGYPDGRFSDGRIITGDLLAVHLGLRPVNPWLDAQLAFDQGANYAIPGSTASAYLAYQLSLHLQLVDAVHNCSSSSSSSPHCSSGLIHAARPLRQQLPSARSLRDALYVLYIGGIDYSISYTDYGYPEDVNTTLVALVVADIKGALETLYERGGAREFVVAGVAAQGCVTASLASFPDVPRDSRGCLEAMDNVSRNSRQQTLDMLRGLARLRPDANYTFLDFHSATHYIIDHAQEFGFTEPFSACCGAGSRAPYGFNLTSFKCSNETESLYVCPNPRNFMWWDGVHPTEAFNFQMFNQTFLTGSFMYSVHGLSTISVSK